MWDDLVAWFQSPGGARVLQTAVIPALAILVAGVLAALIGRAAVRSSIARADRVEAAGAVAGLVEAARAATEADAERGGRRRAARLRTESDVRTRLLTLPGAALAADWAGARTDALLAHAAEAGPVQADLDELRDRLVAWVNRPSRARRIFGAASVTPIPSPPVSDSARTGPRRHSASAEQPAAAEAQVASPALPPPVVAPVSEAPEPVASRGEAVPAWQRTRSGERLQQERERAVRARVGEPAAEEPEQGDDQTAPVVVPSLRRASAAPAAPSAPAAPAVPAAAAASPAPASAEADEAVRLEAHQQARHARPIEEPAVSPGTNAPSGGSAQKSGVPAPAWLDVYDDEAQVTQNLDLKTPPPVSASAVRGRGAPGEDLVPRS
ncbi:hypothetical protein [uncultured Amnibacterium sp.]|uniref:hypothetical protein n=1 Tax=uncultured Amnibacterium sp. TaxID=1631851 RepID=UPI0035C96319